MATVFIHGAGRSGTAAWQQVAEQHPDRTFLSRRGLADDAEEDAHRVIEILATAGGGHVVAHSYGANAAVLAFQARPDLVHSAALLEPACFDLARSRPAVEEHIAAVSSVFSAASDPAVSATEFAARFAAATGAAPLEVPEEELADRTRSLRALHPPWGLGLDPASRLPVPVLVVTGGWSDLYEQTARALETRGAQHALLRGHGHRVQDHPGLPHLLGAWWRSSAPT